MYNDFENSKNGGSKIFLYLFDVDGIEQWGYTTDAREEDIDGVTYFPCVISSSEPTDSATEGSQDDVTIEVPFDLPVVLLHVPYLPPRPVSVTIRAYHRNDPDHDMKLVFQGFIRNFQQQGVIAQLVCTVGNDPTGQMIPRGTHGAGCRHATYGDACGLDRDDFKTIVNDITGPIVGSEITAASIGTKPDDWFWRGYAENPATGEVRYILSHTGNTVKLVYPFTGLLPTDTLNMYAGDDKQPETCRLKFDNKPNYLGFDFFPLFNLFVSGVRTGAGSCGVGNGEQVPVPPMFGPVLWLKLGSGGSGDVAPDSSGYGNHGTWGGNVSGGRFVDHTGCVVVPSASILQVGLTGIWSAEITAAVEHEETSNMAIMKLLMAFWGSAQFGYANYMLALVDGGLGANKMVPIGGYTRGNTTLCATSPAQEATFGTPVHIVATKGPVNGICIYRNGQRVAQITNTCAMDTSPGMGWAGGSDGLCIGGAHYPTSYGWIGTPRNACVYPTELSAQQVSQLNLYRTNDGTPTNIIDFLTSREE